MTSVRSPFQITTVLQESDSSVRLSRLFTSVLQGSSSALRVPRVFTLVLQQGYSSIRVAQFITQILYQVTPEPPVSTNPFPGFGNSSSTPSIPAAKDPFNTALPGLGYSIHKKPKFSTLIAKAANAREVRNAMQEMPVWGFEFNYEFLSDAPRSVGESSLHTIMGFFLARQGSFDTFLLKDPDDYLVTNGLLGASNGTQTAFYFRRYMGEFGEIVGQVDTANTIHVYHRTEANHTVGTGPYTVTISGLAFDYGVKIGGTPLVKVPSAPASGQYAVDTGTGVYTFNSAQNGATVAIDASVLVDPSDYVLTAPNIVTFDVAPSTGSVYASFQFFFAVRFEDDQHDYEKFMDSLWSLNNCKMESVIQ